MSARAIVRSARTALFVPGNRPDRFGSAMASGADVVIIDLEDAVESEDKTTALEATLAALEPGRGVRALVRINAPGDDNELRPLVSLSHRADGHGLLGIVVPKAQSVAPIAGLRSRVGQDVALLGLIESAAGVVAASALAADAGLDRLAFGAIDFALDAGGDDRRFIDHARAGIVIAARAAGMAPPLDSPSVEIDDLAAVLTAARDARAFGFGGKLCIHPRQVAVVVEAYRPTDTEIDWARRVSGGEGARRVDGAMVDLPVVERARRILVAAGERV